MPSPHAFGVFCGAALILLVIPGPAVLYVVTRSASEGRSAGMASVVGLHVGTLAHVTAAAVGLSAVLVSSAQAFRAVKWAGAAYLVYLGVRAFIGNDHEGAAPDGRGGPRRAFGRGIMVNLLNPKLALFFLAFLPQFVDPARGAAPLQVVALGVTFVVLGVLSDGVYALVAAAAGSRIRVLGSGRAARWVSGTVYMGLGVVAGMTGASR